MIEDGCMYPFIFRRLVVVFARLLFMVAFIVYAAPPPPSPDDLLRDNGTWIWNVTEMINWYTTVWWGPAAYVVVFLVPASVYIKTRSIALASAAMSLLFGMISVPSENSLLRYVGVMAIALGISVLLYRVFWRPERYE